MSPQGAVATYAECSSCNCQLRSGCLLLGCGCVSSTYYARAYDKAASYVRHTSKVSYASCLLACDTNNEEPFAAELIWRFEVVHVVLVDRALSYQWIDPCCHHSTPSSPFMPSVLIQNKCIRAKSPAQHVTRPEAKCIDW